MPKIFRFGISLEKDLLDKFDQLIRNRNYSNRSEAFRDLIRQKLVKLVKKESQEGHLVAGAVNLTYERLKRELLNTITDIQHDFQKLIISTQHIHLNHNNCLEIIAVKGHPREVQKVFETLISIKGVKHGTLSMSTTGKNIG